MRIIDKILKVVFKLLLFFLDKIILKISEIRRVIIKNIVFFIVGVFVLVRCCLIFLCICCLLIFFNW